MSVNNSRLVLSLAKTILINNKTARAITTKQIEKILYKRAMKKKDPLFSKNVTLIQYYTGQAMANSLVNNLDRNFISKKAARRLFETLVESIMFDNNGRKEAVSAYKNKHGIEPPLFITLSPTKKCNLNCEGCYASSKATDAETLDWATVDKIMHEAHDEMGMRFFVLSGGEPLMYKHDGMTVLDLARKWNDSLFMMYTNGTLISEKIAGEIAELGNITPAISVEGFEEHTDQRRGAGMHKKILTTMNNLRNAGVPFGTSITATKNNAQVLLDDRFYEYYFKNLRASYMWIFHYMPIGRKFTTELMLTPDQRFEIFIKWKQILKERQWFVADFWNSGMITNGCISCARGGGYFYIDWNGNIMPCVFIPYYKDNVKDLFKQGKKIQDALFSDFFIRGREWQGKHFPQAGEAGNLLMPCFIRDHHKEFIQIAQECKVLPEDVAAKAALYDQGYHDALIEFDAKLNAITEPYWSSEYSGISK